MWVKVHDGCSEVARPSSTATAQVKGLDFFMWQSGKGFETSMMRYAARASAFVKLGGACWQSPERPRLFRGISVGGGRKANLL